MIVNERVVSFINSMNKEDAQLIRSIEQEAREGQVPIIRTETKEFLKVLLLNSKPCRILEVGTAVGYSAIYMSQYMPKECTITTIEKYKPRIEQAKQNIKLAQKEDCIQLLEGDAADILKKLTGSYDFIFMDAAKGQYINFLPDVIRLLDAGGLMVSDNVLQDGDVLESHYAVTKRNRTIHSRMREYLYTIKHHDDLETAIVPIGDGIAISTKIGATI